MSREAYPHDFDRLLSPAEVMAFASEIVWPAVDHLYGGDFRLKAQVLRSTRLRPKTIEIESEHGRERLTIEAQSPRNRTVINENGEQERECWVEITIAELRPELVEGAKDIMDVEIPEDDDLTDEDEEVEVEDYGTWWRDDSIDWQPWEVKSFDFTNNKLEPFRTFFDLEVQDEDEDDEHFLWSFTEPERLPNNNSMNKIINRREDELETMLSYRECLEIRAALIRFGVPAEKMAVIE